MHDDQTRLSVWQMLRGMGRMTDLLAIAACSSRLFVFLAGASAATGSSPPASSSATACSSALRFLAMVAVCAGDLLLVFCECGPETPASRI